MQKNLNQLLFGDKAILVTEKIADHRQSLYPEERALISGVIEKRAHEFSTGRFCARQALLEFGIDNFPVLRGEQREPIWPKNIVGSISHCKDIAGAVVACTDNIKSVGFDIENRKQVNPDIARHICTKEEKCWLDVQNLTQQNLALLVIFSIKEAIYKCVYQTTGQSLRFRQCQIIPSLDDGIAEIMVDPYEASLQMGEICLRFHITDTHVYSYAIWQLLTIDSTPLVFTEPISEFKD